MRTIISLDDRLATQVRREAVAPGCQRERLHCQDIGRCVKAADAENVYFDDVDDRRFIPETIELRTVTAGHLGNSPADQRRAAEALRLPLLSSTVEMEWSGTSWRAGSLRLGSSI